MEVISIERSTYEELMTSFNSFVSQMKAMAGKGTDKRLGEWLDNQDGLTGGQTPCEPDDIEFRNRSNKTKPLVEYLRLSFSLIGWCSWIGLTKGQARVRTSLIYYYYASTTSAGMPSTLGSQGDRPPVIIILRHH